MNQQITIHILGVIAVVVASCVALEIYYNRGDGGGGASVVT